MDAEKKQIVDLRLHDTQPEVRNLRAWTQMRHYKNGMVLFVSYEPRYSRDIYILYDSHGNQIFCKMFHKLPGEYDPCSNLR